MSNQAIINHSKAIENYKISVINKNIAEIKFVKAIEEFNNDKDKTKWEQSKLLYCLTVGRWHQANIHLIECWLIKNNKKITRAACGLSEYKG